MTDLDALIRDIEAATGPDRALDERIALAVGCEMSQPGGVGAVQWWRQSSAHLWEIGPPNFTGSLNAARRTFGDHPWCVEIHAGRYCVYIDNGGEAIGGSFADTEILAVLAASMRLKQREDVKP
jgi:hypothetical protein